MQQMMFRSKIMFRSVLSWGQDGEGKGWGRGGMGKGVGLYYIPSIVSRRVVATVTVSLPPTTLYLNSSMIPTSTGST